MAEVYLLSFPNGKGYVGRTKKTVAQRFRGHCRSARHGSLCPVHSAIRKYRPERVVVRVLASGIPWSKTASSERHWIRKLATMTPGGYNLTAGGEGLKNWRPSPTTRAKIAKANAKFLREQTRRNWQDPEYRRKQSESHRGRKLSKRTRARMSASRTRAVLSEETIRKRSKAAIALWADPKYRAKQIKRRKEN